MMLMTLAIGWAILVAVAFVIAAWTGNRWAGVGMALAVLAALWMLGGMVRDQRPAGPPPVHRGY